MKKINIFTFIDYKKFVNKWVSQQVKSGRGQFRKMADYLNVSTVVISQIFRGERHLNSDQAAILAGFFAFNELESLYWLDMVSLERAGTRPLKTMLRRRLQDMRAKSQKLESRISNAKVMTAEQNATFYSSWRYSAVRLATTIDNLKSENDISRYLGIPLEHVQNILQFLLHVGLLAESKGEITLNPQVTHLGTSSTLINNHRRNWRLKALERLDNLQEEQELSYSGLISISQADAHTARELLLEAIAAISALATESKAEQLNYLNIDFLAIGPH